MNIASVEETPAQRNCRRFTQMYVDAYRGNFNLIREIIDLGFVCRNPLQPADGIDDLEALLQSQIDAIEGLRFEVRSSFASEEGFGIAYAIHGRHIAPLFGIEPSHRDFTVTGVSIHEIVEGHSIGVFSSANFLEVLSALHGETDAEEGA